MITVTLFIFSIVTHSAVLGLVWFNLKVIRMVYILYIHLCTSHSNGIVDTYSLLEEFMRLPRGVSILCNFESLWLVCLCRDQSIAYGTLRRI